MNDEHSPQPAGSINGFRVLLFFLAWTVAYFFLAPSLHHWLRFDRLPARLEVLSYLLHLIPFLGLPIAVFWFLDRRERRLSLDADTSSASQEALNSETFSHVALKSFVSTGSGLVFNAPDSWIEGPDPDFFQVIDPATGSEFTASVYANSGLFLEQWGKVRNDVVLQQMPYLERVRESYGVVGHHHSGIATEYQGMFPGSDVRKHYLVLCLRTEEKVISFTITATAEVFAKQEAFYRRLLTQLDIYEVKKVESPVP